jgi:reductive dehalogenase
MKALGLAGAGIGVAGTAAPVFHDLDELIASPLGGKDLNQLPWWVKEREHEDPTIEMDWNTIKPYTGWKDWGEGTGKPPFDRKWMGYMVDPGAWQQNVEWRKNKFPGWDPGHYGVGDQREDALRYAATTGSYGVYENANKPGEMVSISGLHGVEGMHFLEYLPEYTSEWPKWEGTPEDNLRMVRAVVHFFGGSSVGALEITDNIKKLFYKYQMDPKPSTGVPDGRCELSWEDVDKGYYTTKQDKLVVPNKCQWVMTYTINLPQNRFKRSTSPGLDPASNVFYPMQIFIGGRIQNFFKGLGYQALGGSINLWGPGGAWGNMSGLGEQGRHAAMISVKYGSGTKGDNRNVVDLPLAPTRPVDAGIHRFCETCGICINTCVTDAIQKGPPTWDSGRWNNVQGYKGYRIDWSNCSACTNCQVYCPFFRMSDASWIHSIVRSTVATTPVFNGFFRNMEEVFDYGSKGNLDEWWNSPGDVFGFSKG